ncbi:3'-5' exonuclease [Xanthomonas sp. NCPPB 2654]|uniref:DEAD/DEAH box helicase n=1 Tax=unclassified Xanthomonas TaxID=2643310 RepID=UPI0021E02633|nr:MULTISPECIES: 3'-5' exonuclease [unclassified Xanthomonas]MDL5367483.1 3'-5' exonuclease [Xanthomonas sp. NCPPB 2654]UYC22552.1 NERD domain-containing protein [Xanthomonas sp. CFBP 8443]
MAALIPSYASCSQRMTTGERRFAQRLIDKLEDDYLCWYDVPVGPKHRHPDFVVLHPSRGFLVLEAKDWKLESIAEINRDSVVLHTERGRDVTANPVRQSREYTLELCKLLQRDPALRHPDGSQRAGKLMMPWGWGVVLTNITRHQFEQAQLEHFIPSASVICRDEMTEATDPEDFQKRLWDMFMMPFACQMSLPQIDRFRWHLFPELRIPTQGNMFDGAAEPKSLLDGIPDLIKIMDLQQEQLARSLGDGHRVIHGVAGSGKTMILGYRCLELARRYAKPVLVLCYNKTLAGRLQQLISAKDMSERIVVAHFHGWCRQQLEAFHVRSPAAQSDGHAYAEALVRCVIDGVASNAIPRAQYAAVLIDEGHDFKPEWFQLVVQMIDPETNALLLLYDDAQALYDNGGKRKFTFASVGIQAQGRTTILRMNYRNSLEVLATAKAFARELLESHDADDDHVPVIAPESAGRRGPLPELLRCRNIWDEAERIALQVAEAIDQGANANDFAVLCRSNQLAKLIANRLIKERIPVVLAEDSAKRSLFEGAPSVKVMTMHSSKGLEFDTVFIPGICEIGQRQHGDEEQMLLEAKLLYVAMTRALGRLVMLHHGEGVFAEKIHVALADVRARLQAA